jgi:hypothetical protein
MSNEQQSSKHAIYYILSIFTYSNCWTNKNKILNIYRYICSHTDTVITPVQICRFDYGSLIQTLVSPNVVGLSPEPVPTESPLITKPPPACRLPVLGCAPSWAFAALLSVPWWLSWKPVWKVKTGSPGFPDPALRKNMGRRLHVLLYCPRFLDINQTYSFYYSALSKICQRKETKIKHIFAILFS